MKFLTCILANIMAFAMTACAQKQSSETVKSEVMNKNVLVAYFSATGTTERVANLLADATSGDIFEIAPVKPYTSADLNWNDSQSRSTIEMKDESARPEIKENVTDIAQYDVIFIGYPIWWDLAPRLVNTFIENNDLKGKIIIPFATSGGSSINHSASVLKSTYPELKWQTGKLLNGATEKSVGKWVNEINLN